MGTGRRDPVRDRAALDDEPFFALNGDVLIDPT